MGNKKQKNLTYILIVKNKSVFNSIQTMVIKIFNKYYTVNIFIYIDCRVVEIWHFIEKTTKFHVRICIYEWQWTTNASFTSEYMRS